MTSLAGADLSTAPGRRPDASTHSSAERVADLLLAFAEGEVGGDHGVSELSRTLGRERSQISRMLHALERRGLVEQDRRTRRYRLGWSLLVIAATAGDDALLRAARPILRGLVTETGETAFLSVLHGRHALTVLTEESTGLMRAAEPVGGRSPLHCTAAGRALLFDSEADVVEALTAQDLATDRPGPATTAPCTLEELHPRLRAERERGWAVADEEVEIGLTSIGVPVRGASHDIVAAVSVSGPTARLSARTDELAHRLQVGAEAIRAATTRPRGHAMR